MDKDKQEQSAAEQADAAIVQGRKEELARQKEVVDAVAAIDFSKLGGTPKNPGLGE